MDTYLDSLPKDIIQYFHNIFNVNLSIDSSIDDQILNWCIIIDANGVRTEIKNKIFIAGGSKYQIMEFEEFIKGNLDKLYYCTHIKRTKEFLRFKKEDTSIIVPRTKLIDEQLDHILDVLIQLNKSIEF
uniref:Uncharacterized protein n=1 Tax=Marseillevirus LCMAC102 TaxID=2506603 RepID=A0A481YTZ1_9VIRU|nr:MAG: hypothetical protein LCMAC102_00290 [Marseillevirus LCMAC102]